MFACADNPLPREALALPKRPPDTAGFGNALNAGCEGPLNLLREWRAPNRVVPEILSLEMLCLSRSMPVSWDCPVFEFASTATKEHHLPPTWNCTPNRTAS